MGLWIASVLAVGLLVSMADGQAPADRSVDGKATRQVVDEGNLVGSVR